MVKNYITTLFISAALMLSVAACGPSLVITDVNYTQPVESVVSPDADNVINDRRYAISFSITSILEEENIASTDEVRLIRNRSGYYFVTAAGFNHIYVFKPASGELELENKIELTTDGLGQPALNQRGDHIEVVDRATGQTYRVTEEGRS